MQTAVLRHTPTILTYTDETRHLASWRQVTYGGKALDCEPTINYEHYAPTLIIRDSLSVSPERFVELRAENPLLYLYEGQWIQITLVIAGLVAFSVIIWRWRHYPYIFQKAQGMGRRLFMSLLVGLFNWFALAWGLGALINLLPVQGSAAYWNLIAPLALIGAVTTFVWEWKLSGGWKPETAVFRIIYSIGGSFVVFAFLNFLLVGDLLILGFVD